MEVAAGDRVPADIVLISANEMRVNNSTLTGETEDLLRDPNRKS